jgi:hypothetical protein
MAKKNSSAKSSDKHLRQTLDDLQRKALYNTDPRTSVETDIAIRAVKAALKKESEQ